ncbi:MAG: tRNA pseudouridine(38-40) synthase TruA [Candidatus Omnitrophica bacterium]|nr:tRNA pseudouridine(38-40) synthase TruA [Candidatus Omnitrophota bacterium]
MRTLKLTIAYDGTRYGGWQVQHGHQASKPTIQGTLETILRRILRERVVVVGSGRTDAGVHAMAQVAHIRTRSRSSCAQLLHSLNQLLPADIAVLSLEEVDAHFHAQYRAIRKRYRYRIFTGTVASPFIRPYVHQVRAPLQVARMRREAAALRGRHDFRAFTRGGGAGPHTNHVGVGVNRRTTTRTIGGISLTRRNQEVQLDVEGNGFLHTMVRTIAGTLIDVGRGRLPAGTIRRMLTTGDRRLTGTVAPARGLTLISVEYGSRDEC